MRQAQLSGVADLPGADKTLNATHIVSVRKKTPPTVMAQFSEKQMAIGCVTIPAHSIHGGRIMVKAIGTVIAAAAALALAGGAYAQSNNTLATPSTVSPAAANTATSGYGTPGATGSDSGMGAGSSNPGSQNSATPGATPGNAAYGVNNTLATPSTASPAK
jgi:hypothetical protein